MNWCQCAHVRELKCRNLFHKVIRQSIFDVQFYFYAVHIVSFHIQSVTQRLLHPGHTVIIIVTVYKYYVYNTLHCLPRSLPSKEQYVDKLNKM